jgi:hypothetical protein
MSAIALLIVSVSVHEKEEKLYTGNNDCIIGISTYLRKAQRFIIVPVSDILWVKRIIEQMQYVKGKTNNHS